MLAQKDRMIDSKKKYCYGQADEGRVAELSLWGNDPMVVGLIE